MSGKDGDEQKENRGYNSDDEHQPKTYSSNYHNKERKFKRQLKQRGYFVRKMKSDGACLFRAVADQVYGDQEMHNVVRRHCMSYIESNEDYFSKYITEEFSAYITRKREETAHGNHVELQALSEMYNRPIEVYRQDIEPMNTFRCRLPNGIVNPPIRLSYQGSHYNSIVDPNNPSVGIGLGLPGYEPGVSALKRKLQETETEDLEGELLSKQMRMSEEEAVEEDIAAAVAKESYLQWLTSSESSQPCSSTDKANMGSFTRLQRNSSKSSNSDGTGSDSDDQVALDSLSSEEMLAIALANSVDQY